MLELLLAALLAAAPTWTWDPVTGSWKQISGTSSSTPATTSTGAAALGAVTVTSPLTGHGTATDPLAIPAATTSVPGHLTAADWTTFNGKASVATDLGNTAAAPHVVATHLSAALPVAQGGTAGTATPTAGAVAYGVGGTSYGFSAAGTEGQFLLSGGTGVPTWGAGPRVYRVTAETTTRDDTTGVDIAGLALRPASSATISLACWVVTSGTATSGPRLRVLVSGEGPASVVRVEEHLASTTADTIEHLAANAWTAACTSSCTTSVTVWNLSGIAVTDTDGYLTLQLLSSTSGQTVRVKPGSWCALVF